MTSCSTGGEFGDRYGQTQTQTDPGLARMVLAVPSTRRQLEQALAIFDHWGRVRS